MKRKESVFDEIENRVRSSKGFGVLFGIDAEDYHCELADGRLVFGKSNRFNNCGNTYNYQEIIVDGNVIGHLREYQPYNIFEPMRQSFRVCLPDDLTDDMKNNPHLIEDEFNFLSFARLQDMLDYLNIH